MGDSEETALPLSAGDADALPTIEPLKDGDAGGVKLRPDVTEGEKEVVALPAAATEEDTVALCEGDSEMLPTGDADATTLSVGLPDSLPESADEEEAPGVPAVLADAAED